MVGKISRVPLRDVWPHEASDFTPWLLENLDFLNDVLPFVLLEAEREQAAGTSYVDLVAKDSDGETVVIENQLETSDHEHLGKLLTYLAVHVAKRAVWIVRDAKPEHIDAINWLNKMGPVEFFLLRAEVVKVGEETGAKFELITGPSDTFKAAGDTKRRQAQTESVESIITDSPLFAKWSKKDRKKIARSTEHAVRLLWDRTGDGAAYDISRTYEEFRDMIARHTRLLECVKHLYQENDKNTIGVVISCGYAAALCFLMASSATDLKEYYSKAVLTETNLDFSRWDAALRFWSMLAKRDPKMSAIHETLSSMVEKAGDEGISRRERLALIAKAWINREKLTVPSLQLKYQTDEDGIQYLVECPTVGGIDKGEATEEAT
jgi:hypothetical protein